MNDQSHTVTPRIYVACLAAYNNGQLHGQWIDASQSADDIYTQIASVLKSSPQVGAEEWAVHDYEGFGGIHMNEWPDIERVAALARLIEDHGGAFALWYEFQDAEYFNARDLEENLWSSGKEPTTLKLLLRINYSNRPAT
jgi:antirestriction protein